MTGSEPGERNTQTILLPASGGEKQYRRKRI